MANMSISPNSGIFDKALADVPKRFREKIVTAYLEIKKRYQESTLNRSFDAAGISAGKFCESILRFLQHQLTNQSIPFGRHVPNFNEECQKLINLPSAAGSESLRVVIPRALVFLYTMRGKRGIGHVGGDIEANGIDLATIVKISDWIMCELLRIFHNLPIEDAQALLDSISIKSNPIVWDISGKKRILRTDLNYKQKILLLLYSSTESSALTEELCEWAEHPNASSFRRDVLRPMHRSRLIEYDGSNEIVYLSPLGLSEVETTLLQNIATA
jgi:hypothetical protein